MATHFKTGKSIPGMDLGRRILLIFLFGIILVAFSQAQQYPVTITIAVSPPYPPKVNEYISAFNPLNFSSKHFSDS